MREDSKACNKCHESKSLTSFAKNKSTKDGLQYTCNDCKREYAKKYQQDNRERLNARSKQYRIDNVEAISSYRRQYRANNKELVNGHTRRHKALKRNQQGYMPLGWFEAMQRIYGYQCAQCGDTNRIEIDHVKALANGGLDEISNLQFLCKKHNAGKRDHHDTDYRSKVRLLDTVLT